MIHQIDRPTAVEILSSHLFQGHVVSGSSEDVKGDRHCRLVELFSSNPREMLEVGTSGFRSLRRR
jgi:hypothetical protein